VTVDGRQVRFLNVVDEFTREALAVRALRSCTADALIAVLDEIIAATGRKPTHIRMDNGTEMTAHAMTDWCRFTGVDAAFIDPGSPWQNRICESFNGRFRDEFLDCEVFHSLTEVQVLAEDWRIEYNNYRPQIAELPQPQRIPSAMVTDRVQPTTATHMIGGPAIGAQSEVTRIPRILPRRRSPGDRAHRQ
ncbi:integrase core domain-containing protein, partial [Nocardia sp. NPDC059228]|uniref:integrase core domain-containing protein n=1 Tax=Nocardia sp. NPDC059228 TaxID=3346777 RepID=UPI003681EC30